MTDKVAVEAKERTLKFMRILIIEDQRSLARALVKIFKNNNYSVEVIFNGEDAIFYLESGNYDVAILDIMIPIYDGIEVLKKVRHAGNTTPILILSAKSEVEDRIEGLNSGANYYLTKPFDTEELLAAIRAITRSQCEIDTKITFGNLSLDRLTYELSSPYGSFKLANKEYQLMEMFMTNPKKVMPTERILEKIWGYNSDTEINVVWVYISYLRKKLTVLKSEAAIKSSRNAGYFLEGTDDTET